MPIMFFCKCGHKLRAPDTAAGKRGKCPRCGEVVPVPHAEIAPKPVPIEAALGLVEDRAPSYETDARQEPAGENGTTNRDKVVLHEGQTSFDPAPAMEFSAPASAAPASQFPTYTPTGSILGESSSSSARRYLYWVLLVVLIPLGWSTFAKSHADDSLAERLQHSLELHPEAARRLEALSDNATKADLCAVFPDNRLEGALLPDQTWVHWGFAAISGAGFMAAILLLFPPGHTKATHLVAVGLLTGTIGILLLLALQWLAFHMPLFSGHGVITILLDLIWLIGQSYRMALGNYGFVLSFLGFTAGVGFCEEACKALPLILKARSSGFVTWRSAMLWGLISGVGFGVSEGITYSSDYYNGIEGANAYLVRFVSCVGLHGIWAGAVGITIYRRQDFFRGELHVLEWIWRTLQAVIVPMILHGLYDTLLKQNHDAWALGVALASFGWLALQIELAQRMFDEGTAAQKALG